MERKDDDDGGDIHAAVAAEAYASCTINRATQRVHEAGTQES
jgi:hypothetical protein